MRLQVGDIVKNGYGEEFELFRIDGSGVYCIETTKSTTGREFTFTKEGYFQEGDTKSKMNLVLVEEPTACDEYVPVEEPTACDEYVYEENKSGLSTTVCETDRELAIKDVVDSVTKYQVRLTKLLKVSLVEGASFDDIVYLTTLIKDSVETKETIKGF